MTATDPRPAHYTVPSEPEPVLAQRVAVSDPEPAENEDADES